MGARKSGVVRRPKGAHVEARYSHVQIVHDMRGVLNAFKLGLDTLGFTSVDELQRETVGDMLQTVGRFEQLITRLLRAVPNVKEAGLRELVQQSVQFFGIRDMNL